MEIRFGNTEDGSIHRCESCQEGDWIVFSCPDCYDYERRLNWRTGETFSESVHPEIQHSGFHFSNELISSILN